MCQPDFFKVSYEINPWMEGNINQASQSTAAKQWQGLAERVSHHAKVKLIQPQKTLPDMVFTANGGLIHGKKVIISQFTPKERQGESDYFHQWFTRNGFEIIPMPRDLSFEGAGDALFDRSNPRRLWAAYGFRSSYESHQWIASQLDIDVMSLKLIDARFYHLDTCFCPLNGGYIMYYPGAFSDESLHLLHDQVDEEFLIKVSEDDAIDFALNAVNLGDVIILHKASHHLRSELEFLGFKVIESPVDEFMKAGGSTKCLTLRLDEAV